MSLLLMKLKSYVFGEGVKLRSSRKVMGFIDRLKLCSG
jgi:hypothetical protein